MRRAGDWAIIVVHDGHSRNPAGAACRGRGQYAGPHRSRRPRPLSHRLARPLPRPGAGRRSPGNTAEVAAVVGACAEAGAPIVPQGGNTGQCGGATPDDRGTAIVVSLQRMNRVRAIDADNATLTVDAGVPLGARPGSGSAGGTLFPLSPRRRRQLHDRRQSVDQRRRHGGAALWQHARPDARASRRCSRTAGCGTGCAACARTTPATISSSCSSAPRARSGIVTAAVLKLFPAPRSRGRRRSSRRRCRRRGRGCSRELGQAVGDRLVGFELMSAYSVALSRKHHPELPDPLPGHPWYVLVQVDDSRPIPRLEAELERALAGADRRRRARATPRSPNPASRRARSGRCARTSPRRSGAKVPTSSTTSRCRYRRSRAFSTRRRPRSPRRCRVCAS